MSGSFFGRPEPTEWHMPPRVLRKFEIIRYEQGEEFVEEVEASYVQLSDRWVCFYVEAPGPNEKDFMIATFNADLVARMYEEPREEEGK